MTDVVGNMFENKQYQHFLQNSWCLEYPKATWLLRENIFKEIIDMPHCNTLKDS